MSARILELETDVHSMVRYIGLRYVSPSRLFHRSNECKNNLMRMTMGGMNGLQIKSATVSNLTILQNRRKVRRLVQR